MCNFFFKFFISSCGKVLMVVGAGRGPLVRAALQVPILPWRTVLPLTFLFLLLNLG